jgi:hypothetical protein
MNQYAKFAVAAIAAGLVALQTALTDGTVTSAEWVTIAIAVVGALGVWIVPNADPPLPEMPGKHELKEDVR